MPYKDPEKQRAYQREWARKNYPRFRERKLKWNRENRDQRLQYDKEYRLKNSDKIKAYREANREKHNAKDRERYWQRKIRGICTDCGAKTTFPRYLCPECAKKHAEYNQKRRARYKKNGLCVHCGRPTDGYITCETCSQQIPKVRNEYEDFRYPNFT